MPSELEAATVALTAARARLDAHLRSLPNASAGHAALTIARDQIDSALIALSASERTSSEALAVVSERPLLDQIVLLRPTGSSEAFRTKIKLKAVEQRVAIDHSMPKAVGPDDLTRVRGIDRIRALALIGLGFETFRSIAAWDQSDVQRVSGALKLGREISRQNWIEQAELLSRAEPVNLQAVDQRFIEPSRPVPAEPTVSVVVVPKNLAPELPAARLVLIKGLSASDQALLHAGGVRRWADIEAWQHENIADWQTRLGPNAKIAKDCWVAQAALLATGSTTRFAKEQMSGVYASLVPRPMSEALPPPIFEPWVIEAPTLELAPVAMSPVSVPEPFEVATDEPLFDLVPPDAPPVDASSDVSAIDLPTALDRVAALELELASLVANDTAARVVHEPEATFEPVQRTSPAPFNIEDEEFLELNVSEADVVIVPRNKPIPTAAPIAPDAVSTRTLLARMRRVPPIDDIEADRYAAYRDRAEEASVEIIRVGQLHVDQSSVADGAPPKTAEPPIKRLLRSLKRQD